MRCLANGLHSAISGAMVAEFVEGGTTINFRADGLGFSEAPSTLVGADGKSIAQIPSGTPFRNNNGPLEAGHFLVGTG